MTSPATVRGVIEGDVDVALQSLMGRSILGEPGYVAEERLTGRRMIDSDTGLRPVKVPLCCVCGPASGLWLSGAGISYEVPPDALCFTYCLLTYLQSASSTK